MQLTSNIGPVIGRLERLAAALPVAAKRAIDPVYWKPRLETLALKTVRAQWASEKSVARREIFERWTPRIVASLSAVTLPLVSEFTLGSVISNQSDSNQPGPDVAGAIGDNLGQRTPTGRMKKYAVTEAEAQRNLDAVRAGLLEWVREAKRKETWPGGRDAGLSDKEIADRLEWILGLHEGSLPGHIDPEQGVKEALERMAADIQKFMEESPGAPVTTAAAGMPADVLEQWLAAVLAAWRAFMREEVPAKLERELERELGKIRGSLL